MMKREHIGSAESALQQDNQGYAAEQLEMLSSAIAANLAKGNDLETAVERAKEYISGALAAMLDLGAGSGPMNHAFDLKEEYTK